MYEVENRILGPGSRVVEHPLHVYRVGRVLARKAPRGLVAVRWDDGTVGFSPAERLYSAKPRFGYWSCERKNGGIYFVAYTTTECNVAHTVIKRAMEAAGANPFHQMGEGNEPGAHAWENWGLRTKALDPTWEEKQAYVRANLEPLIPWIELEFARCLAEWYPHFQG